MKIFFLMLAIIYVKMYAFLMTQYFLLFNVVSEEGFWKKMVLNLKVKTTNRLFI